MAEVQQDTSQSSPDIGSLVGGDKSAISDLVKMQGARTAEDFAITRKADAQLTSDQARAEKAYTAEGVGHDELKPWDANKEHAKFEHDPIEGFGSVGGVFAMVASAFTKTPMDNAILGMAGALNSIKAGDEAAYERAYGSWKDNTKLALDRHKVQHDLYSDALSLMDHNQGAAQAKLHNAAVRFGDSQMLTLAEHGMVKELFELQESRARAASQMQKSFDTVTESTIKNRVLKQEIDQIDQSGLDPILKEVKKLEAFNRVHTSGQLGSEASQGMAQWAWEHRQDNGSKGPTAEERAEFYNANYAPRSQDPKSIALRAFRDQWAVEHNGEEPPADKIQEYESKLNPQRGGSNILTKDRAAQAEIERRKQEKITAGTDPAKAFDEATVEVNKVTGQTGAKLDEKTLDSLADQAIAGDTSVFTNLGRGKQGAENVIALRARIAEKLASQGKGGADQALNAAEYGGKKAALRTAGTREATVGIAAFEAKNMMTIAREASDKVERSKVVPFNQAVQAVETRLSDPDLKRFIVANNSLVNGYVRAISPTGVPTDIVRKHAYDMLSTVDGQKAYNAVLDIMNNEMDAAIAAPAQMRDYLMGKGVSATDVDKKGHAPETPAAPYKGDVIKYDASGNRVK